ncbi:MAG: glycine--tRNA ligase subunit beta [Nitrospirae bacterium]|nr:glycine--tRNA ligase subunit beta [Nitrospirota bacterium]
MNNDLLLEIGTEEIPARFMPPAIAALKESSERLFKERRLQVRDVVVYGTPRRIVLIARGLSEIQGDLTTEVLGPPKGVAFDKDGMPTKAAIGFAKGQGVDVSALRVKSTEKGEYLCIEKHEKGQRTRDILPAILEEALASIAFPKAMRWNDTRARFARPIKWILALLNGETLSLRFAGIESGSVSYGHHFMRPGAFQVKRIEDYFDGTARNFVIVDPAERRRRIGEGVRAIAEEKGGSVVGEEELFEEVTFLTEYPVPICGRFDEAYLALPKDVLITVMRAHQRCFSLEKGGKLLPYFIAVSNTDPKNPDIVRNGYERVIRARLSDAKFFFEADCRKRLETHAEKLRQVVFMGKLGTLWDKVQRLTGLSGPFCSLLGYPEIKAAAEKAAQLAKADLMTEMVGEFPELQGVMGMEYAVRQGETEEVAQAIYEHYLPRFSGDILPSTPAGKVLAIAEKIDNLVGCFGTGNIPTGSYDPYALRRQSIGILNILIAGRHLVSLKEVIRMALTAYGDRIDGNRQEEILSGVLEFMRERLSTLLATEGYRYDGVRAVLATGLDDPYDAFLRITALERFRQRPEFESLTLSFKRVMNIIPPDFTGEVREGELREREEKDLYSSYREIKDKVLLQRERHDYENAFASVAELKPKVDLFFDKVLVMDKDMNLRNNRLSLLNDMKGLFLGLADFTQIVIEGD